MQLYFRKTIGRYKKGSTHNVRDSLARVYLSANIAVQDYERKVIAEPVSKNEFHAAPVKKSEPDEFEGIDDADQLRVIALERGVKVHWNAGADKIKEALRNA